MHRLAGVSIYRRREYRGKLPNINSAWKLVAPEMTPFTKAKQKLRGLFNLVKRVPNFQRRRLEFTIPAPFKFVLEG